MKKITTLAVLPILALASCGTKNDTITEVKTSQTPETNTSAVTKTEPQVQDLNPKVGFSEESGAKPINFDYTLPNNQKVQVTWTIIIQSWAVAWISLDWVDASKSDTPIQKFASTTFPKIVWEPIKGLKVDSVSGASLVSEAFNNYLTTINK